jgi:hypothetical protein
MDKPFSESAVIHLGSDSEVFLLSPLADSVLTPISQLFPNTPQDSPGYREQLLDAAGVLLHASIGGQPLNALAEGREGLRRIAAKLLTMSNTDLLRASMQVIDYSHRGDRANAFYQWIQDWAKECGGQTN